MRVGKLIAHLNIENQANFMTSSTKSTLLLQHIIMVVNFTIVGKLLTSFYNCTAR